MATHSTIIWESPWTEEPNGLQSTDTKESDMTQQLINTNRKTHRRPSVAHSPETGYLVDNNNKTIRLDPLAIFQSDCFMFLFFFAIELYEFLIYFGY